MLCINHIYFLNSCFYDFFYFLERNHGFYFNFSKNLLKIVVTSFNKCSLLKAKVSRKKSLKNIWCYAPLSYSFFLSYKLYIPHSFQYCALYFWGFYYSEKLKEKICYALNFISFSLSLSTIVLLIFKDFISLKAFLP